MRILVKLDSNIGSGIGPILDLSSDRGEVIPKTVTIQQLLNGVEVVVTDYFATKIKVKPSGTCNNSIFINIDKQNPYNVPNIIGINSAYVGFGASTGSFYDEHWIHDFSFTSSSQQISYSDLKTNSTYVNNAILIGDSIRLTPASGSRTGNVFLNSPIKFKDSIGTLMDWSAYFVFTVGGGNGADGLSFILQSNTLNSGGIGGGIGYTGIPNSVAVGYDVWYNYESSADSNANQLEINVNGSVNSLTKLTVTPSFRGSTGTNGPRYNWIDYINKTFYIYYSSTNQKPSTPTLVYGLDISNYIFV
jgi:hypothetical protein